MSERDASSEPKVTIVVLNYRGADDTIRCVRSLRELTYPRYEILIVDNDSRDGSVERLRSELPGVRLLVADRNGGYTAGNNLGIELALRDGADYVHLVNPDTVVCRPEYLTDLVRFLQRNPRVGVVGPKVRLRTAETTQNTVLRFPWLWRRAVDWVRWRVFDRSPSDYREPIEADALNGVCVLFRATCLREVGSFDPRLFAYIEDIDWAYRAVGKGWSSIHLPVDGVIHLQQREGYARGSRVDFLLKRNTLYFLLKTGRRVQAAGYTLATLLLACAHSTSRLLRGSCPRPSPRWIGALARDYLGLWTARWDQVMGASRY